MSRRIFLLFFCVSLSLGLSARNRTQASLEQALDQLDNELTLAKTYEINRLQRINALKSVTAYPDLKPEQQYGFYMQLVDEYKAYNFDSTMHYLAATALIAQQLQNKLWMDQTTIQQGFFYATSGNFLEANDVLYNEIDLSQLDPSLKVAYYIAVQRLAGELADYATDRSLSENARRQWIMYRDTLFTLLDPESDDYLTFKLQEATYLHQTEVADSLSALLVARHEPASHAYALYAYLRSLIFEQQQDPTQQMLWLAQSAIADIRSSVKDNAALCRLATILFETGGDVERAFHYIDISMQDAMQYNAKLRPWQIAAVLPQIEKAYQAKQQAQSQAIKRYLIIISSLTAILLAGLVVLVGQFRRTSRAHRQMAVAHKHLQELNTDIADANRVKEKYIGLFLGILSDKIDSLKEFRADVKRKIRSGKTTQLLEQLDDTQWNEKEVATFYRLFDAAFLELYPHFVESFNELLVEEEQITLKKGELLNTELRIFALIRLGITDSGKIASLLRYSVNTIYNYRAKIKNNACISRDDFEESVMKIGA